MGTMFLLVRLLDAITDPIMGAIADATSTRWGCFRPRLLAICVPFAVSVACWCIPFPPFPTPEKLPTPWRLIYL
ncbi:MFS transporter [Klebsiella pneumoniae subsp. pneumoniae]|nr:MFS transporter [Klebsiella pneumoniae subsp. pneumoniae]